MTRAAASTLSITITSTGTAGVYISGIEAFNSTLAELRIVSVAVSGWTTGQFTENANPPYSIVRSMQLMAPDLVLTELCYNDFWTSVPLATAMANLGTIIGAFPSAGRYCARQIILRVAIFCPTRTMILPYCER